MRRILAVGAVCTLGIIGGLHEQYKTVEDPVRPLSHCTQNTCVGKVEGVTAIPAGRYRIVDTYSPKFKHNVLLLMDVPGFQGIRIHSGNDAEDTEGCLILGMRATPNGVAESNKALRAFNAEVRQHLKTQQVWITITNDFQGQQWQLKQAP